MLILTGLRRPGPGCRTRPTLEPLPARPETGGDLRRRQRGDRLDVSGLARTEAECLDDAAVAAEGRCLLDARHRGDALHVALLARGQLEIGARRPEGRPDLAQSQAVLLGLVGQR